VVKNRAAYQRGYNKAWKQARRARLIEMLGGGCVRCGATEDLEFDVQGRERSQEHCPAGQAAGRDASYERTRRTRKP
jgi:hypothetical protein